MTDLQRIEQRISALKTELAELEIAARVIRKLPSEDDGAANDRSKAKPAGKPKKASRMTILDVAQAILKERGEQHYEAVAKEALTRGYVGKKGSTHEAIAKSFWATMKRNPDTFNATGGGKFKLKMQKAQ